MKTRIARLIRTCAAMALLLPAAAQAQLTREQKLLDFQQLAAIYAKNYKPHEWKLQAFGFNLLDLKPWIARVEQSKDDLAFYDVCIRYVASLKDGHNAFTLPSDFYAYLPLIADLYDGKVLIETIDRTSLPIDRFPIQRGDEIVAIDGKTAAQWMEELLPYSVNGNGNDSARRRLTTFTLTDRFQSWYPYAHLVPEMAKVEIRRGDGEVKTYEMAWEKLGTPLETIGRVPNPVLASAGQEPVARQSRTIRQTRGESDSNPWESHPGQVPPGTPEPGPAYMKALEELRFSQPENPPYTAATGFGYRTPVFNPPAGFVRRLGGAASDNFLSGAFPLNGKSVGLIRIPTMSPTNQTLALAQFQTEIAFFNANTQGLVIDVMHNGGGSLCYTEALLRFLIPYPFRSVAYEIRSTEFWTLVFSSSLWNAKLLESPQWVIDLYQTYLDQIQTARSENRGSTGNLPICGPTFENMTPFTAANGTVLAYNKPIIVLTNEFSFSAAESFAGLLQDANRVTVYGTRTGGGGGNPASYNAGHYSMGSTRATRSLVTRSRLIATPGLPAGNHMENIGVYPDIWADFMTIENFETNGKPFVDGFLAKMTELMSQ